MSDCTTDRVARPANSNSDTAPLPLPFAPHPRKLFPPLAIRPSASFVRSHSLCPLSLSARGDTPAWRVGVVVSAN
jgi:hypothetical protein